jgi:hypothetical protein
MEAWLVTIVPQAAENLESCFANGYFLGQLLYCLGLMDQFTRMVNSERYTDSNLGQVAAALALIGIDLSPERVKTQAKGYIHVVLNALYAKLQTAAAQQVLKKPKRPKPKAKLGSLEAISRKFEEERLRQVESAVRSHHHQEDEYRQVKVSQYLGKRLQDAMDNMQANHIFKQQWEAQCKKKAGDAQQLRRRP